MMFDFEPELSPAVNYENKETRTHMRIYTSGATLMMGQNVRDMQLAIKLAYPYIATNLIVPVKKETKFNVRGGRKRERKPLGQLSENKRANRSSEKNLNAIKGMSQFVWNYFLGIIQIKKSKKSFIFFLF